MSATTSGQAAFASQFDVSRETLEQLVLLHDLVIKWNRRINLIGRGSETSIWQRHIADSAQLWSLRPETLRHWADLGSGGGFPGLVIAILAAPVRPEPLITLVESNTRKAIFLGEAARALGLQVTIENRRVEAVSPLKADVVSARAVAPLERLLDFAQKHRGSDGIGLFPKGMAVHKEVEAAQILWRFEHRIHRSVTDPDAAIVEVGAISRA